VYQLGDKVEGEVVVTTKGGLSHNGLVLSAVGQVTMQLSPNSVGLFDAFSNSLKPASLMSVSVELLKPGKLGDGASTIPFSFPLQPSSNNRCESSLCPVPFPAIKRVAADHNSFLGPGPCLTHTTVSTYAYSTP
jgi:hypothetical protein